MSIDNLALCGHATAAEDCSTAALVAVTDSALPLHGIWTIIGNNKL